MSITPEPPKITDTSDPIKMTDTSEITAAAQANRQPRYTRSVLLQMLVVFLLLFAVIIWQWEVVRQIYLVNQINAIGWVVNGGIVSLFLCGLTVLIGRFCQYHGEESAIVRFLQNLEQNRAPLLQVKPHYIVAMRYQTLQDLHRRCADINQNALAATLLANESSRNSFPKFVHNTLILTGVFGTIISLSFSLLGAADMIHGGAASGAANGLGSMIFGMSTALSTTMTAILAYLIFGYFYIKLTDTQTYLISRVEEVTATTLLPHLQLNQRVEKDYADSVRSASRLIERFDQSQQQYENAVQALLEAARSLSQQLADWPGDAVGRQELEAMLTRIGEQQQQATEQQQQASQQQQQATEQQQRIAEQNHELLSEAVNLLREGFRLQQ